LVYHDISQPITMGTYSDVRIRQRAGRMPAPTRPTLAGGQAGFTALRSVSEDDDVSTAGLASSQ